MAFRLDISGDLEAAVPDMWLRQIKKAERCVERHDDIGVRTLEVRKCCKRIRALLRLIRPALRKRDWLRENARYRDLARKLAAARDQAAMRETLERLAVAQGLADDPAIERARVALGEPFDRRSLNGYAAIEAAEPFDPVSDVVLEDLRKAESAFRGCGFAAIKPRHILSAYAKAYAAGREEMALCYLGNDSDSFHEWRKRVQHFWRQSALLYEIWPEGMVVRIETARRASKALGLDHDLSVMIAHLDEHAGDLVSKPKRRKIRNAAHAHQAQLRDFVEPLALRLYALEPEAFEAQAADWWQAANLAADVDMSLLGASEHATG